MNHFFLAIGNLLIEIDVTKLLEPDGTTRLHLICGSVALWPC
ncbi:hypothetical protein SPWS13_2619 [Shewanella putrefaciens]|nr:hypothetical protein SPWS13_2619 [Shewanella putrefaciens]